MVADCNRPAAAAFRPLDWLAHRLVYQFADRKRLRERRPLRGFATPARAKRFDGNLDDRFRRAAADRRSVAARDRRIVDCCRRAKSRRRIIAGAFS